MTLTAKVYDSTGDFTGLIIYQVLSLSTHERLDEIPTFTFTVSASDPRAYQIQQKRRVIVYDNGIEKAQGYIRKVKANRAGKTLMVECDDLMAELARVGVGYSRKITAVPVDSVVTTFASEGGWSAVAQGGDNVIGRFTGESLYGSILEVAKRFKYHVRKHRTQTRTIEVGDFGTDSGVTVSSYSAFPIGMENRQDIAILGNFDVLETSADIVNRIYPFGGGTGEAVLDLSLATFNIPYPILFRVVDGITLYYLEDTDSIQKYGLHEAYKTFPNISITDPAESLKIEAANQLYLQSAAYLQLFSIPQVAYSFAVERLPDKVQLGNTVRLKYNPDEDRHSDTAIVPPDYFTKVDANFYLTGITKTWRQQGGIEYRVEASNVNRPAVDDLDILANNLRVVQVDRAMANPVVARNITNDTQFADQQNAIGGTNEPIRATLNIIIPDDVYEVRSVIVNAQTLETSVYRYTGFDTGSLFRWSIFLNGVSMIPLGLRDINENPLNSAESVGDSGVVGVGYTEQTYGVASSPATYRFDITNYIRNAEGGMHGVHEFQIWNYNRFLITPAPYSFGNVKFTLEVRYVTAQDNIVS